MRKIKLFLGVLLLALSSLFTGCDSHTCTVTAVGMWCTYAVEYWQHSSGQRQTLYYVVAANSGTYSFGDCDGVIGQFCVDCWLVPCP